MFTATLAVRFTLISCLRIARQCRYTLDPAPTFVWILFAFPRLKKVLLLRLGWWEDLPAVSILQNGLVVALLKPMCVC
jgi:hypothetical protein